ncbi:NYN domain-containing protein [Candidatus Gracilibacteria bacterium]|nr:NYN domain-containing protein [Candidatus Gracilibacteria bacterium]
MKILYIDSQNIHKALLEIGWKIDWERFFVYTKNKYEIDEIKMFVGYLQKFEKFYKKLEKIGYTMIFKKAGILPNGEIKGNVDIDICIESMKDFYENRLSEMYLASGDGDFNSLVDFFQEKSIFGKVFIPNAKKIIKNSPKICMIQCYYS